MTSTLPVRGRQARPASRSRPATHRAPRRLGSAWFVVAIAGFTLALRLVAVGSSYDLFQDEVNYVDLGTSLRHGVFPPVFPGSGPFLLHPPMFFALEAVWQVLFHPTGGYFALVDSMRVLNGVLAAVSAGCLWVLGTRLAGRVAGTSAALLFALDPFILRQNGRAMLETGTMMFLLLGFLVLLPLLQKPGPRPDRRAVIGGFLLGLSIVSKDMAVIIAVLPLAVAALWSWGPGRRTMAIASGATVVPYLFYLAALLAVGQIGDYWNQETAGFRRFSGAQKSTGFSKAGSPSLSHTLLSQAGTFWVTYATVGLGLAAALYLLVFARRARRRKDLKLGVSVTVAAAVALFYLLFFGTIEEQFLYYLLVPAILSVAVAGTVLARNVDLAGRVTVAGRAVRVSVKRVLVAALAVALVYNFGVWVHTRTTPDNGEQRLVSWFQHNAPHPGLIANDTEVTILALERSGFRAGQMPGPAQAAKNGIRYMTMLSAEAKQNYAFLSESQDNFYRLNGRLVFSFHDPSFGNVQIYRTTNPSIW